MAVPDDEHVTLRREDGTEVTLALDDIREATLVSCRVEGGAGGHAIGDSRGSATDDDGDAMTLAHRSDTRWQVRPKCWPRSAS